ncbi:MAG: hypothetical protein H6Q33_3581 [Deltaproteobacteria bacterium]|jgi:hypothetical protein|nr:hypothetical protein [Deltaproteobacteria bacterium]
MNPGVMSFGPTALPKMMIGFVVRRCAVEVGHQPSPEEFAAWANGGGGSRSLFGRPITVDEARLILRHPGRVVTARSAAPAERFVADDGMPKPAAAGTVISLQTVRAKLKARAQ